jgi:serine/threonine protein kinase
MVDRYGHVYLIDFGASKHIEQNSTLTTSLALTYTKGYCPPELADLTYESDLVQALKEIGPWTDIYALGATLYNLLTDSIPPSSNRLYKVGRNAFSFPSNISSSTRGLIIWMMKPDREDRPQSVLDIHRRQKQMQEENEKTTIEYRNQMNRFSPKKEWARNNEKNQNAQKKNVEQVQSGNTVSSSKLIGYIFIFFAVMLSVVCISEHGSEIFAINEGKELTCWIMAIIIFIVGFFLIKNSEG